MTPQLEAALTLIQSLSPKERQQLLQILILGDSSLNSQTYLKMLNDQFRHGITIKQLLTTQNPTTVENIKDLAADFWPQEDSIEDFLSFLQEQRQELI
ncbi:MAG: hypothetical protein HEQ35_10655 [Gloeotrichia echinulata IR180]|jgi:hypothetical protein|nr:hypothetical protein [Gloeotrichia echinulata DEX184]